MKTLEERSREESAAYDAWVKRNRASITIDTTLAPDSADTPSQFTEGALVMSATPTQIGALLGDPVA